VKTKWSSKGHSKQYNNTSQSPLSNFSKAAEKCMYSSSDSACYIPCTGRTTSKIIHEPWQSSC